ncbi:MAG: site-specific integrase, partial [Desulfovibrio sp.]|nr:site-specific integrase [Desulfovibrio sp.]
KEIREAAEAAKKAEKNKVTIGKIWEQYQIIRASKKSLITDKYNFKNHLLEFADKAPNEIFTIDIQRFRSRLEQDGLKPA